MNRIKSLCILLLLAFCTTSTMGETLFDGKTLKGWGPVGDAAWAIEQGEIAAHGSGDGYLAGNRTYRDFQLTVEFWVDAATNSGVFVRCQDRDNIHPETCYELNIWDEHPRPEARTGAVVFKVMPPMARVDTVGKWNTLNVVARESSLIVTINDQVTAEFDEAYLEEGFIALQHFGDGTVRFRNIRIENLTTIDAASN